MVKPGKNGVGEIMKLHANLHLPQPQRASVRPSPAPLHSLHLSEDSEPDEVLLGALYYSPVPIAFAAVGGYLYGCSGAIIGGAIGGALAYAAGRMDDFW